MAKEAVKVFSWKIWAKKLGENVLCFGLPLALEIFVDAMPQYSSIAIGVVLKQLANFLKNYPIKLFE